VAHLGEAHLVEVELLDLGKRQRFNMKAKDFLSDSEKKEIKDALAEAESKTSGEIVPVIAASSGRYDRAEDTFGILFVICALILCWCFFQRISPTQAVWASGYSLSLNLGYVILIIVAGFSIGSACATYFPWLRTPFILKREMLEEVDRRAKESFYTYGIGNTKGATGILIYISLFEQIVTVKGDRAIAEKLSSEDWTTVCDTIIAGTKRKEPAAGLKEGILKCGELLAQHFPITEDDHDEIPNEIHFID